MLLLHGVMEDLSVALKPFEHVVKRRRMIKANFLRVMLLSNDVCRGYVGRRFQAKVADAAKAFWRAMSRAKLPEEKFDFPEIWQKLLETGRFQAYDYEVAKTFCRMIVAPHMGEMEFEPVTHQQWLDYAASAEFYKAPKFSKENDFTRTLTRENSTRAEKGMVRKA